jgi:HTH-type transcriptional regulator, glycine betaine synthesis regulator
MTVDPAVLKVADAVGALIEAWGFRRNMGRMWAVLYLEDHPLTAADLGERLGLSTGAVSMLVNELIQWGIIKKTWVVGERREHFEAETSIWKMISRVFRERELRWIRTAHEAFAEAGRELEAGDDTRHQLIASRVAGLTQLAEIGAHLLETMLQGEAVDSLPIKQLGELAAIARPPTDPDKPT